MSSVIFESEEEDWKAIELGSSTRRGSANKKKETPSCCERLSAFCKNLGSEREKRDGDFV